MSTAAIVKKLWEGSIPIRLVNGQSETLITVPRNSYLPPYFASQLSLIDYDDSIDFYFEYDNVPLQWHLPAGVLYDLVHRDEPVWTIKLIQLNQSGITNDATTIKKMKAFNQSLIKPNDLKEVVMNSVKQSSFVVASTAKLIMSLSPSKSEQFWHSILDHNWVDYDNVNKEIIPVNLIRVPVKIFIYRTSIMIQEPVAAEDTINLEQVINRSVSPAKIGKVVIHGISFEGELLKENIVKVWNLFKYVDNFLYIIVETTNQSEC